jgi:hypothetical protein
MNESSPKQNRQWWRRAFWIWLVLFIAIAAVPAWLDLESLRRGDRQAPYWQQLLMIAVWATLVLGLWYLIRWPFTSWRNFRRTLVGLAVFATLVAVFYAEEDWRGKRAWENCKRELEAKGAVLDWNKYIPEPVPDDQNFFTVNTNFYLRFVKLQEPEQMEAANQLTWLRLSFSSSNSFPELDFAKSAKVVAELTVLNSGDASQSNVVVKLTDATAPRQVQDLIQAAVGRGVIGSQGFRFSELQVSNLVPVKMTLQGDTLPTLHDLEYLIPADLVTNVGQLAVEATANPKLFQVKLVAGRITSVADYLAWSDQFVPAFDDVREALKRPCAMIPGDYSQSYLMPIPNFVLMRNLAQTLAQRTQCHLLLGEPDQALREIILMHDLCRILERPPTGKPETLVEAMINVAITGLYVGTIQEGFRLHAWQEPQMAALQAQLKAINLPPLVLAALKTGQASSIHTFETTPAQKLADLFQMVTVVSHDHKTKSGDTFWRRLQNPMYLFLELVPRGWLYQNMVNVALLEQKPLTGFDPAHDTVEPRKYEAASREVETFLGHRSPFKLLAQIAIPNYTKAEQTTAHNQTLANEAQIVCALERFRFAHGDYPESLAALVPQFIEKLPHDIIGGEPLHYRRTEDGKFLLYSIGWNETDDGGVDSEQVKNKKGPFTDGDWVWQYPAK